MAVASNDEAMRRSIFAFDSGSSIAAKSAVCMLWVGQITWFHGRSRQVRAGWRGEWLARARADRG